MASEPTNSNSNTELSKKPSKAKEEGELSSNDADDDGDDNNNNDILPSKTLAHIQTFNYFYCIFGFIEFKAWFLCLLAVSHYLASVSLLRK